MPYFPSKNYKQGIFNPQNKEKYKGKLPINYRSGLEFKFCMFCDCNRSIVEWGIESVIVPYIDESRNNTKHNYVVDFVLTVKDKDGKFTKFLVEVKPSKETVKPIRTARKTETTLMNESLTFVRNQCKWKYATAYAESKGMKFQIITEKDINVSQQKR